MLGSGYQRGILASIPAVVASDLVATASGWPSPLEAPAEWLMEWTPLPIASYLLLHASALAHPAALLGALALLMLIGGGAGSLAVPVRYAPAHALLAVLFFTGGDAAMFGTRTGESLFILATVYFLSVLGLGIRIPRAEGRRDFLLRSAAVVGGAAVLLALSAARPMVEAVAGRRLFRFRPPPGLPITGLSDPVTSVGNFYVMDKVLDFPVAGTREWRLAVNGQVARPQTLDLPSLLSLPAHHRYITLECVDNPIGGPLMGNALWTGVTVRDLMRRAGAAGTHVVFESADNYAESLPLSVIKRLNPLIAYGMNGETLSRAHGYPARLVVPGLYGFKSVKWLTSIHVAADEAPGEWAEHGWNEMPQIQTTARIDVARRRGASILLAGVALAGVRGVRAVEVRVNGGPWRAARLGPALSAASWVQWTAVLRRRGRCRVEARAVDGAGHVQSGLDHGAYPSGASGWDSVSL